MQLPLTNDMVLQINFVKGKQHYNVKTENKSRSVFSFIEYLSWELKHLLGAISKCKNKMYIYWIILKKKSQVKITRDDFK